MCGIVGYVGYRQAVPVLIQGLEHLEYRGYDSAGLACLREKSSGLWLAKEKGKLSALKEAIRGKAVASHAGIGHTRWATHGEPSRANAHPHVDFSGRLVLVHNGIVENYEALKAELSQKKVPFASQTDTEVAANLIGWYYKTADFTSAFVKAIKRLEGFFCFVAISPEDPGELLVFRRSNPICIGLGNGENFIASDVTPLLAYTKKVLYLEDEEYARVSKDKVRVYSLKTGKQISRAPVSVSWDIQQAKKGGYPHYMLKEIFEQPRVMSEALNKRLTIKRSVYFDTLSRVEEAKLKKIKKVFIVSCGTAYHAGLVGGRMLEDLAKVPAVCQVSSEFRYTDPIVTKDDLVILITQSGETADTLAALREAKRKGAMTLAVVNVLGSTIAREAAAVIYTHAGPEIGVASTKAYTAQLMTLAFFSIYMARIRKTLAPKAIRELIEELRKIPAACEKVLESRKEIRKTASKHYKRRNFLYLGRGYNYPTALEGALKLKEISYAHAHGYAAGEMKHGPIALVDSEQPVLCITPESKTYEKMISNIQEIRAREGIVISIGSEGDAALKRLSHAFWPIPRTPEVFSPILAALPLQLFAYEVAVLNGRDVDQPRNLAKSVTVE